MGGAERALSASCPRAGLEITVWLSLTMETWKRANAELAHKWSMTDFEEEEPNRREFRGDVAAAAT